MNDQYIEWKIIIGLKPNRKSTKALKHVKILLASQQQEFLTFWQRVCKLSNSILSIVDSLDDITEETRGQIMLTDDDCRGYFREKAEHFDISIVSTVWVVQSLILGEACDPDSHPKLKLPYEDEDY